MDRNRALSNLTRFTLLAGAAGQLIMGSITLFAPEIIHKYLWPPPLDQVPDLWLRYDAVVDLALALGGIYALRQNDWTAARTFLFTSTGYVALLFAVTISLLLSVPDQPPVIWLYVLIALLYLPLTFATWRRESARVGG